jgi:hypothetical protein
MPLDHPFARKDLIDTFVSSLSPWEWLYLKQKLRRMEPPAFATLDHLPQEIFELIFLQVPLIDALRCRLVSKTWQRLWTQSFLIERRFPGLLHQQPESKHAQLYLGDCRKYFRRHLMRGPPADIPSGDDTVSDCIYYYNDGVLAHENRRGFAQIHNLRTGGRYQEIKNGPILLHGFHLDIVGVSGLLVVFSKRERRHLHVYHLVSDTWEQLSLPAGLDVCHVYQDRVVAVTASAHAIYWQWQAKAIELAPLSEVSDMSDMAYETTPGVLFHPHRPGIVFTVWACRKQTEDVTTSFVVVKHEDGKLVGQTWKMLLPAPYNHRTQGKLFSSYCVSLGQSCQRINAHGSHALAILHWCDSQLQISYSPGLEKTGRWAAFCFNTVAETFTRLEFLSPRERDMYTPAPIERFAMTDDQLVLITELWAETVIQSLTLDTIDGTRAVSGASIAWGGPISDLIMRRWAIDIWTDEHATVAVDLRGFHVYITDEDLPFVMTKIASGYDEDSSGLVA